MTYADRKDREGIPGNRRGRPHGYSPPVTIMTVSLDPSTLRLIDESAAKAGRSRSAFVRTILMDHIGARMKADAEAEAIGVDPITGDLLDPTHGGRFRPDWKTTPSWNCPHCAEVGRPHAPVGGWLFCPHPECKKPRPQSTYPPEPVE